MNLSLAPLPVAVPMLVAAILLSVSHLWPRRVPDSIATLTAVGIAAIGLALIHAAADAPINYWFGGWQPHDGVVLGIGFQVDQVGAAAVVLISTLFAAAFVFAWGFFDEVGAVFHVLMLLFMAAMNGFCLTHDLFNMFVWFEVMSVAAFALTAFRLEGSALEAGLNFTVTNSLASFLMLTGIGLAYARGGALDFTALHDAVARMPGDPVMAGAFCLLLTGLLIKGALAPFQLWLADAHALAPSPVCVIFSGAMVGLGVYGVTKLSWQVFGVDPGLRTAATWALLATGVSSAVIGGAMCLAQRHVKRMLAFATISHTGCLLIGTAVFMQSGTSGTLLYLAGHGLTKGALFMTAGILLALCGSIDEIALRGRGRDIWPAGIAMAIGGLLLAGLPVGLMHHGETLIEAAADGAGVGWAVVAIVLSGALTGGAVLRSCGRIYLGLGEIPDEADEAPTDREEETSDRPLWLMLLPCGVLLMLAVGGGAFSDSFMDQAVGPFLGRDGDRAAAPGVAHAFVPWLSLGLAVAVAAYDLLRFRLPGALNRGVSLGLQPVHRVLEAWHSGLVGDYVAWIVVGLGLFAGCIMVAATV